MGIFRGTLLFCVVVVTLFADGYSYLNQLRLQAGMTSLSKNQILEQAAKNHNQYMIANNVFGHYESQSHSYFTGITPADRAVYAGYASRFVSENIAAGDKTIEDAIDGLFSAIYHRFGFLDFTIDEVGGAFKRSSSYGYGSVSTFDMGNKEIASLCAGEEFSGYGAYVYNVCADPNKKIAASSYQNAIKSLAYQNPSIVLWPYKDATNIPPVFYEESPDPLPECSVSGYPISVNFNPFKTEGEPELVEFSLEDEVGNSIELVRTITYGSDPNGKFSKYDFAIFPAQRLEWGEDYQARFVYTLDNQTHTIVWKFRTKALPGVYYKAQGDGESYSIVSGKKYYFYFPPRDCNDKLSSFHYSYKSGMNIENGFYDQNTIWMRVVGQIGDEINVRFNDGRSIRLIVATRDSAQSFSSQSSISSSSSSVSTISSSSSVSCPNGYEEVDGICIAMSQSSNSSSSSSSIKCPDGFKYVDGVCAAVNQNSSSSSSISKDTAKKLAGRVLDISGYFAYYGDSNNYDPFAWVYLSKSGKIFAKLEGMDEQTGKLKWIYLNGYFEKVVYNNGRIEIGDALYISGIGQPWQILSKLENKELPIAGYFAYYGDLNNYDPFAWVYVSKSGNLLVKLLGMDPQTGRLRWEYLIGKGKKRIKSVKIIGDKIYIGDVVEDGAFPFL